MLYKSIITSEDLILRGWTKADIEPFALLNSDALVMEHFIAPLSFQQTVEFYDRIQHEFAIYGFGLYVAELKQSKAFMGYVGLHNITFDIDFAPAVEIGWRLLPEFWGKGYATQAAVACMEYAKQELGLHEIYSFTSLLNKRSERVMQKTGMTFVKEFDHPLVALDHPLLRHRLYRKLLL